MVVIKDLAFHNVGAFEEIPGIGNGLVRVPQEVRNKLQNAVSMHGMDSIGSEIRFVCGAQVMYLYVSAQLSVNNECATVSIYRGNFLVSTHTIRTTDVQMIRINPPAAFGTANEKMLHSKGFAPNVWRIVFGRGTFAFHGLNTHGHDIRKPNDDELPAKKWLAYGSSITTADLNGYPHVASKILDVDVQNLGFPGACRIEKEIVDYILDCREFDFITCELGVNMRGTQTPQEFENRARYLLDRIEELGKPACMISIFPTSYNQLYTTKPDALQAQNEAAFNRILEMLVLEKSSPNIHFISGDRVLDDITGLKADLIHPTPFGHAIMGVNLARIIKELNII